MKKRLLLSPLPFCLGVLGSMPTPAEACGGFFCSNTPVVQTGERIIFAVDEGAGTVEVIINISYQGSASDFAWLLPLPSAPLSIDVGSSWAFAIADQLTAPRFVPTFRTTGTCRQSGGDLRDAAFASADASAAQDGGSGGVTVLSQESVGPYDSVVLTGDPDAIRMWLTSNEYRVTDEMMMSVLPYLATNHVLLALKLRKESAVGDLQPVSLTLGSTEPCIPIRLTAIAAQPDMNVTAFILGQRRAIPQNYLHVQPNLALIDWQRFGSNYRQIIGNAADEAGGNAFTTDFAGSTRSFGGQIYTENGILDAIRRVTTLGELLDVLRNYGLNFRPEIRGIMRRAIPESYLRENNLDPETFYNCPNCSGVNLYQLAYDPAPFAQEVEARIIAPDRAAQRLFDRLPYVTRLFTLLSPEEMNLDPTFSFSDTLPDVSNIHTADVITHCDQGDPWTEVVLEDGTRYQIGPNGQPLFGLPAAERIDDIANGTVIKDNGPEIKDKLDDKPEPSLPRVQQTSTCGCTTTSSEKGSIGLAAALVALALVVRSNRARPHRRRSRH
jgi:hypothetical protein